MRSCSASRVVAPDADRGEVGEIEHQELDVLVAAPLDHVGNGCLSSSLVACSHDNGRIHPGEGKCGLLADAAGGSGDHRGLSLEIGRDRRHVSGSSLTACGAQHRSLDAAGTSSDNTEMDTFPILVGFLAGVVVFAAWVRGMIRAQPAATAPTSPR